MDTGGTLSSSDESLLPSTDTFKVNMIFGQSSIELAVGDWVEILEPCRCLDAVDPTTGQLAQVVTRNPIGRREYLLRLVSGKHTWIRNSKGVRRLAEVEILAHGLEGTGVITNPVNYPPLPEPEPVLKLTVTLLGRYRA